MLGIVPASRLQLIRRIARYGTTLPQRQFIAAYLRGVDEQECRLAPLKARAGMALEHLAAGRVRRPGQTLLRVWNPDSTDRVHGSPHTRIMLITEDMPFLVDSIGLVLRDAGATHLIIHPLLSVRRDKRGRLTRIAATTDRTGLIESWQLYEIDRELDAECLTALERRLRTALTDVRAAVADWAAMRAQATALATALAATLAAARAKPGEASHHADWQEAGHLLRWMSEDRFTFLGYRYYRLRRGKQQDSLETDLASGLGILRVTVPKGRAAAESHATPLTGSQREFARSTQPLIITKANRLSTVHRATPLDYVGVKARNARGVVVGEHRFLGLWTADTYHDSTASIPVLRRKASSLLQQFGVAPQSHDGKSLQHALETYPRDELFQASTEQLVETIRGIVNLYERRQVRLFPRRDPFGRFWSCLLYVPRDRYTTQARELIEVALLAAYGGTNVDTQVLLTESTLARLHLRIQTPDPRTAAPSTTDLEERIHDILRTWSDRLRRVLLANHEEAQALALWQRYRQAFPLAYEEETTASMAVDDLRVLEALLASPTRQQWRAYRLPNDTSTALRLKLFRSATPVAVADLLPLFEALGLKLLSERSYSLHGLAVPAYIQEFSLQHRQRLIIDLAADVPRLLDSLEATIDGRTDNDGFNRLVLAAHLPWRDVMVLRAYARWLLQTGIPFSQHYMEQVLERHATTAGHLSALFHARFNPALPPTARERDSAAQLAAIDINLTAVDGVDEDRILRAFTEAVRHTLRTNHFQIGTDGAAKPWLSFKLDAAQLPDLPLPRPRFEVFVFSPRVEGVHLRMGLVSRGGLRWSDRREDFRTEVLGLMKAQNVKNTVIVPVGAKGGFYCKQLPVEREALQREGIECYRTFVRGLLDLTDNIVAGRVITPSGVVRHDGDDPYLVVAADKGTATFSDIANGIAAQYDYWLGDAFASGGSAGYDHKRMAITARGAWECVKRHFHELGRDLQSQSFTCVGIGDMAGDVFGNGLLRSSQLRLVAAFNHQHIFLDPLAAAARGFQERQRLFALPRSSWDDYDRKALGPGGGIYLRSAKSLALSAAAQALLGLPAASAPNSVIRAILQLPVDLLWNGGIGTYIKASDESHLEVGDRANDAVRIDGQNLRAKVIGEGGNLGMTQRGRVEYALQGGRLNTDFIDNSAGVNCSDVEVNIKVLLGMAVTQHRLRRSQRNPLLAQMTDEVSALVLRNNYLQGQALSMLESEAAMRSQEHGQFIQVLEQSETLNRALEFLPTDSGLTARRRLGGGLTRPELAVLLSYSKIWLYHQLITSDLPEDVFLATELPRYFPRPVQRRFGTLLATHPLRREIIATAVTNSLVNRMGPSFAWRVSEATGASVAAVARAYAVAREVTAMREVWSSIEALDLQLPAAVQTPLLATTARQLRHATHWVLTHQRSLTDIEAAIGALRPGLATLTAASSRLLPTQASAAFQAHETELLTAGVPAALARRLATLNLVVPWLQSVALATTTQTPVVEAAAVYLGLAEALGLGWLQQQVENLHVEGEWPALARASLRDQLHELLSEFSAAALLLSGGEAGSRIARWQQRHAAGLLQLQRTLAAMRAAGNPDFATLSVALQAVRRVV